MGQKKESCSKPIDQTVLVTGSAGYIGSSLISRLINQKATVVSLYHKQLPKFSDGIFPVCSDLSSADLLGAPLRGVDTLVHLAWENENSRNGIEGESNTKNIANLKNLLEAMEKARTKRLIYVSASGANANSESRFLREKYQTELFVLNSNIPRKIIIRPSIVCGGPHDRDRFIRTILNLTKLPGIYPLPKTRARFDLVYLYDFVERIVGLTGEDLEDGAYIEEFTSSSLMTPSEVFKTIVNQQQKTSKVALWPFIGKFLIPILEKRSEGTAIKNSLSYYLELSKREKEKLEAPRRFGEMKFNDFIQNSI